LVTIKDVAKRASVSITTASYALNDSGSISPATRKKVLEAAEELNYHPNAFAKNLKKRKTLTIGVFITRFSGSFYEEILDGIHNAILKTDYELIICPESKPARNYLTHRQVDGAIIFDSKIKSSLLVRLAMKTFPIVVLDRYLETQYVFPLLVDNQKGAADAFYHLYNQGARRISYIAGAADSFDNMERTQAFLREAELNQVEVPCYEGNFTEQSGYEIASQIIASQDLPEAVFCANDQMAIGFIKAMHEHHLEAPDDIAVVGFDDIQISRFMKPSLSSVASSRYAWGFQAAAQLLDFLEKGKPFESNRISTVLIPRQSSKINTLLQASRSNGLQGYPAQ
jgi:LacI family transcriptional regulator